MARSLRASPPGPLRRDEPDKHAHQTLTQRSVMRFLKNTGPDLAFFS